MAPWRCLQQSSRRRHDKAWPHAHPHLPGRDNLQAVDGSCSCTCGTPGRRVLMRGFARLIASTPELTISRTTTCSGRHRLVAKGSSPALIERLILSDYMVTVPGSRRDEWGSSEAARVHRPNWQRHNGADRGARNGLPAAAKPPSRHWVCGPEALSRGGSDRHRSHRRSRGSLRTQRQDYGARDPNFILGKIA
jgi:hypothetical protein